MVGKQSDLYRKIGLDFDVFLGSEQSNITNKDGLIVAYDEFRRNHIDEFRRRNPGIKYPNFSEVLSALKTFGDITCFSSAGSDLDQWYSHMDRQPETPQSEAADPTTGQFVAMDQASVLKKRLKKERAELIADKNDVRIVSDQKFENGKLSLFVNESEKQCVVTLKAENTGTDVVFVTSYIPLGKLRCFSLKPQYSATKNNPHRLQPGASCEIKFHFSCSCVGVYTASLAIEFKSNLQTSDAFHIVRSIEVQCITDLGRELVPTGPYKRRRHREWCSPAVKDKMKSGKPPARQSDMQLETVVKLKGYPMPKDLDQLIKSLQQPTVVFDTRKKLLERPLSWKNYLSKFQLLLHLEEKWMSLDMMTYNIPNDERQEATMTRDQINNNLLILEVPGVSENRPSVLRGDTVIVRLIGENKAYRGYVHSVQCDRIQLSFHQELLHRFVDDMKFSVEFTVSRLTLCLQHRAVELTAKHGLKKVLFPVASVFRSQQPEVPQLRLFDSRLEKNPRQLQAVRHIVAGSSKPAPYLLFGPPGTGKTVTLAEAIRQIEEKSANCHILACAHTNSAADQLCEKIVNQMSKRTKVRKVYRMYAESCDRKSVPDELKACSNLKGECSIFPVKETLMEYRIIVTTLYTAGRLVTGGIPKGHFTHVFVDEAGHAEEPECLIPLAGLLDPKSGQVVLAGDPKQLGPIVRCPFAEKSGLGVSLLERMITNFPLYLKNEGIYNDRFVTKLLFNYRSHSAILKIPNELFYDGELLAHTDENSLCNLELLLKKGFPVIFHGVNGHDQREAGSPSFFNITEVEVLMGYVKKLLKAEKDGSARISPGEIGIIAPYRKQVQKIHKVLEKELNIKDIDNIKVGSVEEFQGQERKVILVSTVRSNPDYTESDELFNLGFVKNDKRFNVAVTRAKALLIVVGNPRLLSRDLTWARFIEYCKTEGGYTSDIPAGEDEVLMMTLAALQINNQLKTAESAAQ